MDYALRRWLLIVEKLPQLEIHREFHARGRDELAEGKSHRRRTPPLTTKRSRTPHYIFHLSKQLGRLHRWLHAQRRYFKTEEGARQDTKVTFDFINRYKPGAGAKTCAIIRSSELRQGRRDAAPLRNNSAGPRTGVGVVLTGPIVRIHEQQRKVMDAF